MAKQLKIKHAVVLLPSLENTQGSLLRSSSLGPRYILHHFTRNSNKTKSPKTTGVNLGKANVQPTYDIDDICLHAY